MHVLPRRARWAVSTIFFINGFVLASWVPHIPAMKHRHDLSDGALGLVLLAMAAGAVFALPMAGRLVDRFGSRVMTAVAALLFCIVLPLPVWSPSVLGVAAALALFGACNGTLDVSMNAQAVAVERNYRHAIMSSFHGLFSLGGMVGAATAALAMSAGATDVQHVALTAFICAVAVGSVLHWLLPSEPRQDKRGPVFVRPTGILLRLGLLAFCGLLAEGAMGDWSALYLHDALHATPTLAATGFAAFSLTMAAGRFGGDAAVRRSCGATVLRLSSMLAAAGLIVALLIGRPVVGIIGCACVGLGIANIIPILFSAAARDSSTAGSALASVATTGYLGFLAGPALIGAAAELTSLPLALGLVSLACMLVALSSRVVSETPAPDASRNQTTSGLRAVS